MATSQKTKYPGIWKLSKRSFRIRARKTDPRTGQRKERDRVLTETNIRQALQARQELLSELGAEIRGHKPAAARQTVGEFAQLWIESKAIHLDPGTLDRYATALELHILPALGALEYRTVTRFDIQHWVDRAMRSTYQTPSGKTKRYSVNTVKGWFRVLRTMTQDAMDPLGFERDPTMRIRFAEAPESGKSCAITAEQLACFLQLMREHFPQHYALVVVLAFTGMRWCHASALQWEDWDESESILTIRRKQVRGRVGRVTRKKRVPKQLPVLPEVVNVLRWHRQYMLRHQSPGLSGGWIFPSRVGTLRAPSSITKAWARCRDLAGIPDNFTPHGLRYTFTDLTRLIEADPIARRAITGHVTEIMQRKYSTVGLQEKRAIMEKVHSLVPLKPFPSTERGEAGGKSKP